MVAAAIVEVRRVGEPVLCEDSWSQLYVDYYLGEPVVSLRHSAPQLRAAVAQSPSVLLFVPAREGGREIPRLARRGALISRIPQTGTLYRLRPDLLGQPATADSDWPPPANALTSPDLEAVPKGCFGRLRRAPPPDPAPSPWSRLELDRSSDPFLRSGWSAPRNMKDGASFFRVASREAAVVAPRSSVEAARVSLRLWTLRGLDNRAMRLLVNGCDLGTTALEQAPQTAIFDAPAECWQEGRNLVVLQFSEMLDPGAGRGLL